METHLALILTQNALMYSLGVKNLAMTLVLVRNINTVFVILLFHANHFVVLPMGIAALNASHPIAIVLTPYRQRISAVADQTGSAALPFTREQCFSSSWGINSRSIRISSRRKGGHVFNV